ncbi:MAG: precorrin-3B C(17)-methyltransferase [Pseudomonadota bacterium]|nr:MAG: precorrin-3B C(17)-methyltransferase [Pseudomonadota bacterium]
MSQSTAVFCLGVSAFPVAKKIATFLDAELHGKTGRISQADVFFSDAMEHLSKLFRDGTPIVGVCASAVLIRGVAKSISDKKTEPALVAVAEDGSAVVPLLGGHHGANDMARKISELLGVDPAITTSGDIRFGIALDEPPEGFVLANPEDVKEFSVSMLAGESLMISSDENHSSLDYVRGNKTIGSDHKQVFYNWLKVSNLPFSAFENLQISLTSKAVSGSKEHLVYHPKTIVVGVGCERGTDPEELISLVRNTLKKNMIAPESVAVVVSIDLKSDEPAIHALTEKLVDKPGESSPARFFDAAVLEEQTPKLRNPSKAVFKEVGCHGVAEGAALAAAGKSGKLVIPKKKSKHATCAVAESAELIDPQKTGKSQGTLFIVGTGPGSPKWRLPEAQEMLKNSSDWVGYGLYLDLIADLNKNRFGKEKHRLHRFELGQEEKRVRHALNLAAQGKIVALISSGDPGIYAMATLVFEMLERTDTESEKHSEWRRIRVVSTPGISAMQAAGAIAGAPLGHDFCSISLSDLLTPWDTIKSRIIAAVRSDFVIAFYNPVSSKRINQLSEAHEILMKHRSPDTPVILAHNLGRSGERVNVVTLACMEPSEVNMLTVVIVGSSQSKKIQLPNGVVRVYTPRGYQKIQDTEKTLPVC